MTALGHLLPSAERKQDSGFRRISGHRFRKGGPKSSWSYFGGQADVRKGAPFRPHNAIVSQSWACLQSLRIALGKGQRQTDDRGHERQDGGQQER